MMLGLNSERNYAHKEELEKAIGLMQGEIGMPPWFYNIHELCARSGIQPPPKTGDLLSRLEKAGFRAAKTHFSPVGIKTDADICPLCKAIKH